MIETRTLYRPSRGFDRRKFMEITGCESSEDFCVIDIECVKVPAPTGWHQKTRFKTFMIGIGWWNVSDGQGTFEIEQACSDDEQMLIEWFEETSYFPMSKCAIFSGTRDFDHRVLEGKWVQVRRAHSELPGTWPHIEEIEGESGEWVNLSRFSKVLGAPSFATAQIERSRAKDPFWGKSVEILKWPNVDQEGVWLHNRIDVDELAEFLEIKCGVPQETER